MSNVAKHAEVIRNVNIFSYELNMTEVTLMSFIHVVLRSETELFVQVRPPYPRLFTCCLTAVSPYQRTNRSLISLLTSQVPAIKYAVSLKCKLTAADGWPVGHVWKVSQERGTLY
ncbi:hypothetical protein GOODEAATRI_004451 [Goodea atripinnis]|uniref:Uncharacterized protein n=1 Tax=Goodea atripinnis TaxID=208336 RepID=A0ABV0NRS0_9TELE